MVFHFFFRHGGPPPRALHQSGLTMGMSSVHGKPKFIQESKLSTKHQTQGAEQCQEGTRRLGVGEMHSGMLRQAECKGISALRYLKSR